MKQHPLFGFLLAAALVSADTDARVEVGSYSSSDCQGSPLTTNVYDKTGLFDSNHACYSIGVVSAPTHAIRIVGGDGFPNSNCVLRLFSDDACTVSAGTIGPIFQDGGFPQTPGSCIGPSDQNTGQSVVATGATLTC